MPEARASVMSPGMQVTKAVSLLTPLSAGGMGEVWLADHQGLKTRVVVKFMLGGLDSSDSARTRFSREAAAAAQVKSPHVVQMLDHGVTDAGVPFIVMEHLEGHDLGDEIEQRGAIDPAKVVVIVSQIAKALTKVHAAGLLHRDIKPDNIFLCDGEEDVFAKLLDFGIAKSSSVARGDGPVDGETKTGQIVGTPFYMSPEQVTAQKTIDHRSDLWALGVVAYEALTGTKPYDGPSFGALAVRIATGSPPKPSEANAQLPPPFDEWFAKACARNPEERFSSAKELAEALRAAFEGVVSLPSRSSSGDSGQRSGPVGSTRVASGSTPSPTEARAIGFAATSPDTGDALGKQLGRSEAGVSLARSSGQPSSFVKIAVPVGAMLAAGIVVAVLKTGPDRSGKDPVTASPSAAPSPVMTFSITGTPPAASVSAAVVTTPSSSASAIVDAGAVLPVFTGRPHTQPQPTAKPTTAATPSVKPSAEPSAKPTPTTKPNAPTDPLY